MRKNMLYAEDVGLLKDEYKDIFERIDVYIISTVSLENRDHDAIMEEILDLFISAQSDHRSIEDVIGNDYEKFCQQMIESHQTTLLEKILSFSEYYRYIAIAACVLELLGLFLDYTEGNENAWSVSVEMGGFFICLGLSLLIGTLLSFLSKKLILKYKWYTVKMNTVFSACVLLFMLIICIFLPETLFSIIAFPRYIFIPVTFIFFIFMKLRVKKKKEIDKQEGYFIDFNHTVYNENIRQYRKKYEKYILKCQRNNIEPLDVKTWYDRKYQKDYKWEKIVSIGFMILLTVFVIGGFVTSNFWDAVFFSVILLAVEIPIYMFTDKGRLMRIQVHEDIIEKDLDILDDSLFKEG